MPFGTTKVISYSAGLTNSFYLQAKRFHFVLCSNGNYRSVSFVYTDVDKKLCIFKWCIGRYYPSNSLYLFFVMNLSITYVVCTL